MPIIPTEGFAASALDGHRVVDLIHNGYQHLNACFTDEYTVNALTTLIEGEIKDLHDLEAVETALQIIIFHDYVDILVPSVEVSTNTLPWMYVRQKTNRSQLVYDVLGLLDTHDHLVAQERVWVENGVVAESSFPLSKMRGIQQDKISDQEMLAIPIQYAYYPAVCDLFELPGYFSHPATEKYMDNRGFIGKFYDCVREPWFQAMERRPRYSLTCDLPPLLALVLSYAVSRDEIPEAIRQLRERTAPVRAELHGFNERCKAARSEGEIQAELKRVDDAFRAVIPAALQSNIERNRRVMAQVFVGFGAIKAPFSYLARILVPNHTPTDVNVLVSKTISSQSFSRMFDIEPVAKLCGDFFTPAEMRNLARSHRERRSQG